MHKPRSRFGAIASNFHVSLLSYREFLASVGEHLTEVQMSRDEQLQSELREMSEGFSEEEVAMLKRLIRSFIPKSAGRSEEEVDESGGERLTSDELERLPAHVLRTGFEFHNRVWKGIPSANQQNLLHRSIITGIVGQFEVLLADVAHQFYRRAPRAIEADEKVLSVSELKQFTAIDEAVDYVVSRKIDDLLRGSASDWQQFFVKRLKVDLAKAAPEWPRFLEYIQRRHIIVHAGGRLSRRYLDNVDPALQQEYFGVPELGRRAELSAQYCTECLDAFDAVGSRFVAECWLKLHPDQRNEVETFLDDAIYTAMLNGSWETVLQLSGWAMGHEAISASMQLASRMNYWLASKRVGNWGEVVDDVEGFDCSTLRPQYVLARASLVGDFDTFFQTIDANDGAGLDKRAWLEWPIFDEMRADPRYSDYQSRYIKLDKEDQEDAIEIDTSTSAFE